MSHRNVLGQASSDLDLTGVDDALAAAEYDLAAAELDNRLAIGVGHLRSTRDSATAESPERQAKLDYFEAAIRTEPIERLAAVDPTGRIVLYLRGTRSKVSMPLDQHGNPHPLVLQRLSQSTVITHNHPSEAQRPIGGTLSLQDILLAAQLRLLEIRAVAVEASYRIAIDRTTRWTDLPPDVIRRHHRRFRTALDRAMGAAESKSEQRDLYFYLRVLDFLMVQFAKRTGLVYQREDQPRELWKLNVPSGRVESQSDSRALVDDTEHFRWVDATVARVTGASAPDRR